LASFAQIDAVCVPYIDLIRFRAHKCPRVIMVQ
jgi:hypothetical protein